MTLAYLNSVLTPEGLAKAIDYATNTGAMHRKDVEPGDGSIRRVAIHINDDGSAYMVLHGSTFDGCEHDECDAD